MSTSFSVIVAATSKWAIGKAGKLPWKLPYDMNFFKSITSNASYQKKNAVIMGRNTWDSLPIKFKPLSNRINIIISRSNILKNEIESYPNSKLVNSLTEALQVATSLEYRPIIDNVYVIGGAQIYNEALKHPNLDKIYLTRIDTDIEGCDTFIEPIKLEDYNVSTLHAERVENDLKFSILLLEKENKEEKQYLSLIHKVITTGTTRTDRTGTGTISLFGESMRFSLRDGKMPLLTTKNVFWRGVAEELIWFIKGHTNAGLLKDKKIHIWDGNASRAYLDSIGLSDREENDLGPVYGFQWRHFGAEYKTMHDDYTGQGYDQLANVINTIKNNPTDRRIILSAWNPSDLKKMALPPCHMFCQFYVANGELSCTMYQRSCDIGLGVPFNIASYSLLTYMIAHITGLKPGEFIHMMGDAHVYSNHIEPLKEQLQREPYPFPKFKFKRDVENIEDFTFDDFELEGYKCHKKIEMKMAV